ncbi:MAG: 6-bladed beta-propeller [Bacteroidales bacterium]|nr:6-bladed beta-propeller [Bacteroidales bacterium]
MNKIQTFLLLVLLYSCNSEHQRQGEDDKKQFEQEFFNFDIRNSLNSPKELFLSNFVNEIQYIPLETTPSCLLSEVRYLKIFNDNIFISDNKALYKFNKEGNFIQQIGKVGSGPGEYGQVFWFSIIEESNEIILLSYPSGRINVHDLETGIYKRNFKLNFDTNGFIEFPPGKITFFTTDIPQSNNQLINNEIYICNLDGKIIDSIPNSRLPKKGNIYGKTIYFITNGLLCYMGSYQDTLVVLSGNTKKKPYVSFDLNNTINGNEIRLERLIGEIQFPDFLSVNKILENDKYFFINIQKGIGLYVDDDIHRFLYEKASNLLIYCPYLINNIDEGMPFWPKYIHNNTVLIYILYPFQIIEHSKSNLTTTNKSDKFIRLANNLKENDNPILAFVELK